MKSPMTVPEMIVLEKICNFRGNISTYDIFSSNIWSNFRIGRDFFQNGFLILSQIPYLVPFFASRQIKSFEGGGSASIC